MTSPEPNTTDSETVDAVLGGRVQLVQARDGYRFNTDSVLLAGRIAAAPGSRIIEIGAGVGVVSLIVAALRDDVEIVSVEVQPSLYERLVRNVEANGLDRRIVPRLGDVRRLEGFGMFDLAVMNPPYYAADAGRLNPDAERARARHRLDGDLDELVAATGRLVAPDGRLDMIYPVATAAELWRALDRAGFGRRSVRPVRPRKDDEATRFLVTSRRTSTPNVEIEPPLTLLDDADRYPDEVAALLAPR